VVFWSGESEGSLVGFGVAGWEFAWAELELCDLVWPGGLVDADVVEE
jgi:hypothetical protein